jgi:cytochrome c oxidase cbb3-type subunit 3
LSGIGTRVADPMQLQNLWVSGGGGGRGGRGGGGGAAPAPSRRDVTVTVTQPSGQKAEGRLVRIDDFIVILAAADGTTQSFRRDGDVPKVDIRDPLAQHKKLLLEYSDRDIHNVTAYLVTLK